MVKRITRAVISRLSSHIHDHVITRHQFSSPGALQLRRDVEEIWRAAAAASNGMVDEAVARDAWGASGLESLRLLTLDVAELRVVVKRVMVGGEEARKCVQELGAMEMGLEVRDVRDLVGRRVDAWHSTS